VGDQEKLTIHGASRKVYTLPLMLLLWSRIHLILWSLLVLLLGYALGTFLMVVERVASPEPMRILDHDVNRRAPIVHVEEIHEGMIIGAVGTGARLIIGNEPVIPKPDRSFSIPASDFLVNIISVPVPRGVAFVASKRGKNYYPVDSSAGKRLVPDNRLYFRTAEEAEAMGYQSGY
jgi:hypothetical protein